MRIRVALRAAGILLALALSSSVSPAHAATAESEGTTTFSLAPGQSVEWEMSSGDWGAASSVTFRILGTDGSLFAGTHPVRVDVYDGENRVLSDAGPDSVPLDLGVLESGRAVSLRGVATMPIEAGDDYRDANGVVTWRFQVLEETADGGLPVTGATVGWGLAVVGATAVVVGVLLVRHRRRSEGDLA